MLWESREVSPVRVVGRVEDGPLLILCDHAGKAVPEQLGNLGLAEHRLEEHIAWDIGAAKVAERILERAGGVGVLGGVSRLVIDCNRPLWNPGLVPAVSDNVAIPGNANLSRSELGRRIEQVYLPFHYAIVEALAMFAARGIEPFVFSVHSCTPQMNGLSRPWSVGVAHSADERMSRPLVEALGKMGDFRVGDNEPYAVDADDYTIIEHAVKHGHRHAFVEVRQDVISDDEGAAAWGDRLYEALKEISAI